MRIILLCCVLFIFSCKKDSTPNTTNTTTETIADTSSWEDAYLNGGVLTNNPIYKPDSDIVGTKWVVTKVITGFGSNVPYDTVFFETATRYRIALKGGNGFGAIRTYSYSPLPSTTNIELQMNFWTTLGGSIYTGQVGKLSVEDGIINNAEFIDNQNKSIHFFVWMKKI